MIKNKYLGFTLVEIIISVFIIIILWTIWFLAFSNHLSTVRDASRHSVFSEIETVLQWYKLKKAIYPIPSNSVDIVLTWSVVWKQGTFWQSVIDELDWAYELNVDPLTKNEYTYSITANKKEYQLWWVIEDVNNITSFFGQNANAAWKRPWVALVVWTYNGIFTSIVISWVNTVLSLPSIIASDLSSTNLNTIIANKKLVYNNKKNLPASYKDSDFSLDWQVDYSWNDLVISTWTLSQLNNPNNRLDFLTSIKNSYEWNELLAKDKDMIYLSSLDLSESTQEVQDFACSFIWKKLKYNVECWGWLVATNIVINTNVNFAWFPVSWKFWVTFESSNGNLWMPLSNNGVSMYNPWTQTWTTYTSANTNWALSSNKSVRSVIQNTNWAMFFWTSSALTYCYSNCDNPSSWGKSTFWLLDNSIRTMYSTWTTIWVWTSDWVTKINTSTNPPTSITLSPSVTGNKTYSILEDNSWNMRFATDNWLIKYRLSDWAKTTYKKNTIQDDQVNYLYKDTWTTIYALNNRWVVSINTSNSTITKLNFLGTNTAYYSMYKYWSYYYFWTSRDVKQVNSSVTTINATYTPPQNPWNVYTLYNEPPFYIFRSNSRASYVIN
jgi:Tfp pilus assembly protein PilE